ncbi:MAG: PDZ domain-containing protein [Desulfobacteraceae bacterium]|nr:MAG: PDZ domain-containing protein [Desulfobacteraceae bacterium]
MNGGMTKKNNCLVVLVVMILFGAAPIGAQDEKKLDADLHFTVSQIAKANFQAVVHVKVTRWPSSDPALMFFRFTDSGSGFIMDEQGHVLTNRHLVRYAQEIRIILSNHQRYPARLLGYDGFTNLAVLKIQGNGPFPHVRFGDSDRLELGEWVVALGHYPEFKQTITKGIVRAKPGKDPSDPSRFSRFIQTDVPINYTNSGGPLLNLRGEVIGIAFSPGMESLTHNEAVQSNLALEVAKQLIIDSKAKKSWIGVAVQDLSPDQARGLRLETSAKGALIMDLIKGGPAEQGGLKKGDVVIAFQDREIRSAVEFYKAVAGSDIEEEVKVIVLRKSAQVVLKIKIGPEEPQAILKYRLGAELRSLTEQEQNEFMPAAGQGVMVVWLDPSGPLHAIGLEKGDRILQANGSTIRDPHDLLEIMRAVRPGQWITLLARDHRSGRSGYIQVVLR